MATPAALYTPIDADKKEVRLVKLDPGSLIDQPRCTLYTATLGDPPDFCALSYACGTSEQCKEIQLNGVAFEVKPNLEEALRYLQCVPDLSLIWIDAICIHQADAVEKSQQIGLKHEIYFKARTTYMWIGPPLCYSNLAMKLLREIKSRPERSWDNTTAFSIRQLVERSYWTRMWVIQEAFCSQRAVVKCGHDEADFDGMYDLEEAMRQRNHRPRTDKCPSEPEYRIVRFPRRFPFGSLFQLCPRDRPRDSPVHVDLFRWLNCTDTFLATLPRDHVFALLNLSTVTDRRFIIPDYATTTSDREIFARVTAYLVRSGIPTKKLLPLQGRQVGRRRDLPSWVPDFAVPAYTTHIDTKRCDRQYSAGQSAEIWRKLDPDRSGLGHDIQNNPVQFRFSEDFQVLMIRGLRIDRITFVASIADGDELVRRPDWGKKPRLVLQRQILDAYNSLKAATFSSLRNAYGSQEGLSEALWRNMMANACADLALDNPPSSDYGVCFEDWQSQVREGRTDIDDPTRNNSSLIDFDKKVTTFGQMRAYCCTEKGRVGVVHPSAKVGDCIFVFEDGRVPFLLRQQGEVWTWLGEAYIHGVMYGEALENATPGDVHVLEVR